MWGKIPEYVGRSESIIILGRSHFLFLHRRSAQGSTDLYHQLYTGCGVSLSQPLRSDYNLYRLQTLQSGTTNICRIEPSILLYSKSLVLHFHILPVASATALWWQLEAIEKSATCSLVPQWQPQLRYWLQFPSHVYDTAQFRSLRWIHENLGRATKMPTRAARYTPIFRVHHDSFGTTRQFATRICSQKMQNI